MRRWAPLAFVLSLSLAPSAVRADPPAGDPDPKPRAPAASAQATDEQAAAALVAFEEAFKAKGLKGDPKLVVQEQALWTLAQVQHPTVVDRMGKVIKSAPAEIRSLAVAYLGEQKALPARAGAEVGAALQKYTDDPVLLTEGIEAVGALQYRGAVEALRSLIANKDEFVSKAVLLAIGDMKEMRLLEEVLKLAKDIKLQAGSSWDGGEVHYDSGASGDADQKKAEAIYAERYGNKSHAGKSGGRMTRDKAPILLEALKKLTGQEFKSGVEARAWAEAHKTEIAAQQKALNEQEKAQKAAAAPAPAPAR